MDQTLGSEGRALGSRYVLHQPIGDGAVSQVYRATVRDSGATVAVKILKPELATEPALVAQFTQERSILTSINNSHVIRVIDLVVEGDTVGIVMELVDGEDLRKYLERTGPLQAARAVQLIDQILQGVIAIHKAGIVHRDIKPENILVEESNGSISLKITDLGIASIYLKSSTAAATIAGTPHYMAPEVIQGLGASPEADIYSVGVVLYEMLSGLPPFADSRPSDVPARHLAEEPRRISGIPDDLWKSVASLLAKDPASRPSAIDAQAALRRLEPSLAGVPALRRPELAMSEGIMPSEERSPAPPAAAGNYRWAITAVPLDAPGGAPGLAASGASLTAPEWASAPAPGWPPAEFGRTATHPVTPFTPPGNIRLVTVPPAEGYRRFPSPRHPINEEEIGHNSGVLRRYNFSDREFLLVDALNNNLTLNWTTDVTPVEFAELILEQLSGGDSGAKVTVSVRGVTGDLDAELGATMAITGSDSFNEGCEFFRFDSKYIIMALQILPGDIYQPVKVFGVSGKMLSLDMLLPLIARTATREIIAHTVKIGPSSFAVRLNSILKSQHPEAILEKARRL